MSPDQQAAFLKSETQKHRSAKNKSLDPTGDRAEWQRQAHEIGYRHDSVLRPGQIAPEPEPAQRHEHAYHLGREMLDEALQKQAVLSSDRVREIAARSLITAGISSNPEVDIRAVTQAFYSRGVTLHGQETPLVLLRTVDDKGRDLWSVTTGLKEAEETRLLTLVRQGVGRPVPRPYAGPDRARGRGLPCEEPADRSQRTAMAGTAGHDGADGRLRAHHRRRCGRHR
jgi:hypothetical protein